MPSHFYSIKCSDQQALIIQLLKTGGDDVIQTADGLCVKTTRSESEISKVLADKGITSLTISDVHPSADLAPDVAAFLKGKS